MRIDDAAAQSLSPGLSQRGVRDHNERLLLSQLQRQGAMPASELARFSGLSPPTVSTILKRLEAESLILRGDPVRGKVGKPSVPMALNPQGAFSVGLKMGRRNAALVLADFDGQVIEHRDFNYAYPMPDAVLSFLRTGLAAFEARLGAQWRRVAGIGVARPYQIWEWPDAIGAPPKDLQIWEHFDLAAEIGTFTDLPVLLMNDATAACQSEHVFGRGREFRDYAYFFVGSFIGGGIVLNSTVFEGPSGNAGALGPLPAFTEDGREQQLLDVASLHLLEARMRKAARDPRALWTDPDVWSLDDPLVAAWVCSAATHLARSALTLAAVIDFEAIVVDGAFPPCIRDGLVQQMAQSMAHRDVRGLVVPAIEAGSIGLRARELGAATAPFFARYLLNTHVGLGAV